LAVDTDGDHVCDHVNPLLVPTTNVLASNQAIALQMAPVTAVGAPDLTPPASPSPSPWPSPCTQIGSDGATVPLPLCLDAGTTLTYGLTYTESKLPAIWTIPPVTSTPSGCLGLQFDTLNSLPEGPACVVVSAVDVAGNPSVSAPLRICIDRGGGACNSWSGSSLPDCTGTYDKMANMVSATPCTPRVFGANEVRRLLP
jgi:hypothetical protein